MTEPCRDLDSVYTASHGQQMETKMTCTAILAYEVGGLLQLS